MVVAWALAGGCGDDGGATQATDPTASSVGATAEATDADTDPPTSTASSVTEDPGTTTDPVTGDPTTQAPTTGDPATGDPVTSDPVTSDPTTDSTTGAPGPDFEQLGDAAFWSRRIGDDDDQFVTGVVAAADGFIAAGFTGNSTIELGAGVASEGADVFARFAADGSPTAVVDIDQVTVFDVAVGPGGELAVAMTAYDAVDLGAGFTDYGGSLDVLLAKYEPDGTLAWGKAFGDTQVQNAAAVAFNSAGEVLLVGSFTGELDLGGATLTASAAVDGFIAHFDGDGAHLWSRSIGSGGGYNHVEDVAVDAQDAFVVVGGCIGTVDFGDGPIPDGDNDAFVVKYAADHGVQWKRFYDVSSTDDIARHVAVGGGGVYVTGVLGLGVVDFGGGPHEGLNFSNLFLVKLDGAGAHQWSRLFGEAECMQDAFCAVRPTGLTYKPGAGVVVGGWFGDVIDLGGGPLTTPSGGTQGFAAKFDEAGAHGWSRTIGGETDPGFGETVSVTVDAGGQPILGTAFAGEADVGYGVHTSAGQRDLLLARLPWSG
jgi:hypothetical protein